MKTTKTSSRRRFLARGAACLAGAPLLVKSGVLGAPGLPGPADRVTVGFIGTGGRGRQLMKQLPPDARIAAICDCYLPRCEETNKNAGTSYPVYQDYRKLLDRTDIEAVVVPTTDHGRVIPCIHACQAGKDIYAEKPLTLTIHEGRVLCNAVKKHKRVFQTGTQQRSMEMNDFACRFVREGGLGKVRAVRCCNYTGPRRYTGLPEQPVPKGLDWNTWLSRTEFRPYNSSLQFGWMAWRSYSGGEMTNWGAHGMDQVQWALGASESGPLEVWPVTAGPNGQVAMRYPNGVTVTLEIGQGGPMGGAIVVGEKGEIRIDRNTFTVKPAELVTDPPDPGLAAKWRLQDWPANYHLRNWVMCIKSRKRPVSDAEIGHRSITVCHLANIAREAGRRLTWDPVAETFPGDAEANAYLERPRRTGFELPQIG
jgi:predicted dehydrogenase